MSTGENIKNAVQVLHKTYESVSKMMEQCKTLAPDAGYILKSDKFLRWRTDGNPEAWLINNFILVFQSQMDVECESENEWRKGPVYVMEISLSGGNAPDALPSLILSKFEYNKIEEWPSSCSPADYWGFHQPIDKTFSRHFNQQNIDGYTVTIPNSEKIASSYWGLTQVTTTTYPLLGVNSSNLKDMVFGAFDRLAEQK